jgi:hypothetical protein
MAYTAWMLDESDEYLSYGQGYLSSLKAARNWIATQLAKNPKLPGGLIIEDAPEHADCVCAEMGCPHMIEEVRR